MGKGVHIGAGERECSYVGCTGLGMMRSPISSKLWLCNPHYERKLRDLAAKGRDTDFLKQDFERIDSIFIASKGPVFRIVTDRVLSFSQKMDEIDKLTPFQIQEGFLDL